MTQRVYAGTTPDWHGGSGRVHTPFADGDCRGDSDENREGAADDKHRPHPRCLPILLVRLCHGVRRRNGRRRDRVSCIGAEYRTASRGGYLCV
jgi:hypothetical protein